MFEDRLLIDSYGRRISYLRISLTEACNFRCVYCVPEEGVPVARPCSFLKREEIVRFVRIISRMGVTRIRLTGGEPLLRADIVEIVADLKKIQPVRDLSITTNGSRLHFFLKPLKDAGLDRLNISLDSLNPERFRQITHADFYQDVFRATLEALEYGFPVKVNIVALKDLSRQEIMDFVRLACDYPLEIRFLEFMPLCGSGWNPDFFLPAGQLRQIIREHFELEEELMREDDTAQVFRIRGGLGKVGFIAPVTEPFCNQCSRIRLSTDGKIRPCLFSGQEFPVGKLLRERACDEEIEAAIRLAVKMKPQGSRFYGRPGETEEELSFAATNPYIRRIGG